MADSEATPVIQDWWEEWWNRPTAPARPLALRPGQVPTRPDVPARVPFEACLPFAYDWKLAPYAGAIIPFELAQPGDRQVVVQGTIGTGTDDEPALLDDLADVEGLESIIVDRPIRLTRPLTGIRELIVTTLVRPVDENTLRQLPNLERLCLGRSPGEPRIDLHALAEMPMLEDLRFDTSQVMSIGPVAALTGLRRLRIEGNTFESIAPLAAATHLRWLAIAWWKGMDRLAPLTELESVELNEANVGSLRGFRRWTQVRSLTMFGRRLKSLSGIEHLERLEDLFLYNPGVTDLAPLGEVRGLRRLRLDVATKIVDFAPIGTLRSLESLVVNFKGASPAALPRMSDLAGLSNLRDLGLTEVDGEGWRFLLDLDGLRRIVLRGTVGDDAGELLRRRFPSAQIDVRRTEPRPRSVQATRLPDGKWSIYRDVRDLLGVDDNFLAEDRVRERLRRIEPAILDRLEFDSEADAMSVVGESASDLDRVLRVLNGR